LSIVEKAIDKIRARPASEPGSTEPTAAARAGGSENGAGAKLLVRAAAVPPTRAPRHQVRFPHESFVAQGILPDPSTTASVRDEFRRAKWPLLAQMRAATFSGVRPGAWIIVSALPGEGKTVTAINLALSLTLERDCHVLLVDGDIAKTHISRLFGCENEPGLTDALSSSDIDPEDLIVGTDQPGFALLPAGRQLPNVPELFGSERMNDVLDQLLVGRRDRILLFDSAPVLLTNDAQVLAKHMGQIILVVGADRTPQSAVIEAVTLLGKDRPISCILNQLRRGFWSGYQHGYYGNYYEDRTKTRA
jgi:Mrp family chromosome partitioning ATPase